LFQISVTLVSDICRVRFRYLSCSFLICVRGKLDITPNNHLYNCGLQHLKDIYFAEELCITLFVLF